MFEKIKYYYKIYAFLLKILIKAKSIFLDMQSGNKIEIKYLIATHKSINT
jgi:hypothetical protein